MAYIPLDQARQNAGLKTTTSTSNGYVPLDQARTQLLTANQTKVSTPSAKTSAPVKTTPKTTVKTQTDLLGQVGNTISNVVKGVNFTLSPKLIAPIPAKDIVKSKPQPKQAPIKIEPNQKKLTQPQMEQLGIQPVNVKNVKVDTKKLQEQLKKQPDPIIKKVAKIIVDSSVETARDVKNAFVETGKSWLDIPAGLQAFYKDKGKTYKPKDISPSAQRGVEFIMSFGKPGGFAPETGAVSGNLGFIKNQVVQKIISKLPKGEVEPSKVISTIIEAGVEKTPEGKALIKASLQAEKQGKNITIDVPQPKPDANAGLYDTTFYHGQKVDRPIDVTKTDRGFYLTPDKSFAQDYSMGINSRGGQTKGVVKEIKLTPEAKVGSLEDYKKLGEVEFKKKYNVLKQSEQQMVVFDNKAITESHVAQPLQDSLQSQPQAGQAERSAQGALYDTGLAQEAKNYKSVDEFKKGIVKWEGTLKGQPVKLEGWMQKFPEEAAQLRAEAQKLVDSGMSESNASSKVLTDFYNKAKGVKVSNLASKPQGVSDTKIVEKIKTPKIEAKTTKPVVKTELKPTEPIIPSTSGVAKQIEAIAVEKGMINKGYSELAQYDSSTIKEQSNIASKYTVDDINKIATGEKALPRELKPGTPLSIAEDYAIKNNDINLLRKLANSPLATQISESASELSLSKMRDTNSPVKLIRDIIKTREKVFKERFGGKEAKSVQKKVVADIQKRIKKPDKYDWSKFVDSIQC